MTEADSKYLRHRRLVCGLTLLMVQYKKWNERLPCVVPFSWNEILSGVGSSENCPISFPSNINAPMLSLILDYCRFHQVLGCSNKEKKSFNEKFLSIDANSLCELAGAADRLQLNNLVSLTSRAIAREMNGRNAEDIREILLLPDDLTEEEKIGTYRRHNG